MPLRVNGSGCALAAAASTKLGLGLYDCAPHAAFAVEMIYGEKQDGDHSRDIERISASDTNTRPSLMTGRKKRRRLPGGQFESHALVAECPVR